MAHYALINDENIVVHVITGVNENETQTDLDGTVVGGSAQEWEKFYSNLPWFNGLKCKQTSYNTIGNEHTNGGTPLRGNFAGIGYKYDKDFDVFIAPQPYPSWILDYDTFQWKAPIDKPEKIEGFAWRWSEINKEWIKVSTTQD